jgi:DNA modification methylase
MDILAGRQWHIERGDCIEHMPEMPEACVDFAVFSPPFPSLYAYTDSECDIGNSENFAGDAKLHLSWFYNQLVRLVKPGRAVCVHVMQIPRMKRSSGSGLYDFRGLNIRLAERAGLIFGNDIPITKNPQSQAIRTRSRELQFAGLERDRAKSRPALSDYILKFNTPGDNEVPVDSKGQVSRNEWIAWAEGVWDWRQIKNTDTLNVAEGRDEKDTKHICPLQLEVIRRLVKLYTNPGEIVFSPFTGIGSEGYVAITESRRFYGIELKQSYHEAACRNLARAAADTYRQYSLFDSMPSIRKHVERGGIASPSAIVVEDQEHHR